MKMTDFSVTDYTLTSDRLKEDHTAVLLGDLHETEYGKNNIRLIGTIKNIRPDLILCSGDMLTGSSPCNPGISLRLYRDLASIAPVFASFGNHETKLRMQGGAASRYVKAARASGAEMLLNESRTIRIGADCFRITGLEIHPSKYKKLRIPRLSKEEIKGYIGERSREFQVLIAHNPYFAEQYFEWGADLTVCGHYHGGVMRFGSRGCLISPYFFPFPRYGYGKYTNEGKHLIVTSGLGDHAIPFRINNPAELVRITLKHRQRSS